jgi:hypothetical protein
MFIIIDLKAGLSQQGDAVAAKTAAQTVNTAVPHVSDIVNLTPSQGALWDSTNTRNMSTPSMVRL